MNNIGVFICNYNGKEWVGKCLDSLLTQTLTEFDIYVVDNHSTDGTVQEVKERYGERVDILCNSENLGGAGGFDRGLKTGLAKQYPYIVLLDNDVILEEQAIKNMKMYLDDHEDVGVVGAKVMILDMPDTIQDYGDYLEFDKYKERNGYSGYKDTGKLPEVNVCDYVPTCAVMIRAKALKISGTMPVDNFIYYDDIELSHKMKIHGYSVVALNNVKVWHKGGFRKGEVHTFSRYYFLRNRLHFFAKYIPEESVDHFTDTMLSEIFSQLYGYYNKGMTELFQTTLYALEDFIHGIRGKADEFKILRISQHQTPFERVVEQKSRIKILFIDNFLSGEPLDIYHIFLYILGNIQKISPQKKIWISLEACKYQEEEFKELLRKTVEMDQPQFVIPELIISEEQETFDLELRMCEHVRLVRESVLPQIYVDKFCNCITSEYDYEYFNRFFMNEKIFMQFYRPQMQRAVKSVRRKKHEYAE